MSNVESVEFNYLSVKISFESLRFCNREWYGIDGSDKVQNLLKRTR